MFLSHASKKISLFQVFGTGGGGGAHGSIIYNANLCGLGLRERLLPICKLIHDEVSEPSFAEPAFCTVSYLVGTWGLSRDVATAVSKKVQIKDTLKPDWVLGFLKSHGFTTQQINWLVTKRPELVGANPRTTLKPKVDFFRRMGLDGADLVKAITCNPSILFFSLERKIKHSVAFLKGILGSDENVVAVLKRDPWVLHSNLLKVMAPNVQALRDSGLPDASISNLMQRQPRCLMQPPQRLSALVNDLKVMGFDPASNRMFIYALPVMSGMSNEVWNKKVAVYRSFGWSDNEILKAFRRHPNFISKTEENLRTVLDFFMNKLHVKPEDLIKYPTTVTYGLEKTIIPRCSVLNILMSRGNVDKRCNVLSKLHLTKSKFIETYVTKYQHDIPEVLDAYQGEIRFEGFEK